MRPEKQIARALGVYYNSGALPSTLSAYVRNLYNQNTPKFIEGEPLFTKTGLQVATKFIRTVTTDYGLYIEIDPDTLVVDNLMQYQHNNGHGLAHKIYVDLEDTIMLFYQTSPVSYGDLKVGKVYVSAYDLFQNSNENSKKRIKRKPRFRVPDELNF